MEWNATDAGKRFGELMTKALTEGRQRVEAREGTVVIISEEELNRIEGKKDKRDFIDFLMSGPGFEGVDLERDKRPLRDTEW